MGKSYIFWREPTEFGQGATQVCHRAQFRDHHTILEGGEKTVMFSFFYNYQTIINEIINNVRQSI